MAANQRNREVTQHSAIVRPRVRDAVHMLGHGSDEYGVEVFAKRCVELAESLQLKSWNPQTVTPEKSAGGSIKGLIAGKNCEHWVLRIFELTVEETMRGPIRVERPADPAAETTKLGPDPFAPPTVEKVVYVEVPRRHSPELRQAWDGIVADHRALIEFSADLQTRMDEFQRLLEDEADAPAPEPKVEPHAILSVTPEPNIEPPPPVAAAPGRLVGATKNIDRTRFTSKGASRQKRLYIPKSKRQARVGDLLLRRRSTGEWLNPDAIAPSISQSDKDYWAEAIKNVCREWYRAGKLERRKQSGRNGVFVYRAKQGVKLT